MKTEDMKQRQRAWECGLPAYLQHDLDAYKEGLHSGSMLSRPTSRRVPMSNFFHAYRYLTLMPWWTPRLTSRPMTPYEREHEE